MNDRIDRLKILGKASRKRIDHQERLPTVGYAKAISIQHSFKVRIQL
jgi:hypothetical protein